MSLLPFDDDAFAPALDLLTAPPAPDDLFRLSGSVGLGGDNDRADVIKTQVMLGNTGDFDLAALGAPTGWPGTPLTDGIRSFQKRHGLAEDGLILPLPEDGVGADGSGETVQAMRDELDWMKGHSVPRPQDVDGHYRQIAQLTADQQPSAIVTADGNDDGLPLGVMRPGAKPPMPEPKPVRPFPPAVDLKRGVDHHDELAAPPPAKRGLFENNTQWSDYRAALRENPKIGPNEEFAALQTLAYEGGLRKDPKSSAYGGILQKTLDDAKSSGKVPGLDKIDRPDQLTPALHAGVMHWYRDTVLANVGASAALESLGDKYAAAALSDMLYRHGGTGGKDILLKAVNTLRAQDGEPAIRNRQALIEKPLFDAYKTMIADPDRRAAVLDALEPGRERHLQVLGKPLEPDRGAYFTFRHLRR